MSHTPPFANGTVFKRKLNAIRPAFSSGPPPSGLVSFLGVTITAVPPESVSGDAETVRDSFLTYITVSGVENFESFFVFDDLNGATITANGNNATLSSVAVTCVENNNGRYNTTPGGLQFAEFVAGGPLTITFDPLNRPAGFGCFLTDIGDFVSAWTATVTDEFDVVTVFPLNNGGAFIQDLTFFGWLDFSGTVYKSVTFNGTGVSDGAGIDDAFIIAPSQLI